MFERTLASNWNSYVHLHACKWTFQNTSEIGSALDFYKVLNTIGLLLYMYRLFIVIKFQPRLGLVTSTLAAAFLDLTHWLLLAMEIMVFTHIANMWLITLLN